MGNTVHFPDSSNSSSGRKHIHQLASLNPHREVNLYSFNSLCSAPASGAPASAAQVLAMPWMMVVWRLRVPMGKQKRTGIPWGGALLLQRYHLIHEESRSFLPGPLFICPTVTGNFKIDRTLGQVPIGGGVSIPRDFQNDWTKPGAISSSFDIRRLD